MVKSVGQTVPAKIWCKKRQKKFHDQLHTGFGNRGSLELLSDKNDPRWLRGSLSWSFRTNLAFQMSPIPQTSNWSWIFFCCFLLQTNSNFNLNCQNQLEASNYCVIWPKSPLRCSRLLMTIEMTLLNFAIYFRKVYGTKVLVQTIASILWKHLGLEGVKVHWKMCEWCACLRRLLMMHQTQI